MGFTILTGTQPSPHKEVTTSLWGPGLVLYWVGSMMTVLPTAETSKVGSFAYTKCSDIGCSVTLLLSLAVSNLIGTVLLSDWDSKEMR